MAEQTVLVAIDIGTTKVCVLIGEMAARGGVDVIGIGLAPSDGLRKGVVIDIDRTVQSVASAVEAAERISGLKVRSAFVGISGSHIASQNSRGMVAVSGSSRHDVDRGDTVRAMLDKSVAGGARAWLFDLRGNVGGIGPTDTMASWFLNGEPMLTTMLKNGNGGSSTAIKDFRLPDAYQLPIAIILNDRGGSAPEVLTAALKENKRATIVGQKSTGCVGAFFSVTYPDGGLLAVVSQEYVGAVTGTKYNNVGIVPDVPADDATAVDKAIEVLKQKIAGG